MANAVNSEKSRTQSRRVANVCGPLGGLFIYWMMHGAMGPNEPNRYRNSFVFGNTASWPWYMKHFWPLDLLMVMFGFWAMFRLLFHMLNRADSDSDLKGASGWLKFGAGIFCFMGFLGMGLGATLAGWYSGIEFFFAMGFWSVIILAAFAAGCAVLFGIAFCLWCLAKYCWPFLSQTFVGSAAHKIRSYFNADDIPNEDPQNEAPSL